jgi:NDP-sugar pyrophosphorylase family protein
MNHARKPWKLNHLPVVIEGRPVGLILRADLMEMDELPLKAVIMAGGFGTRMQPHTNDMPKPMLPVGGKPMLEHIVGQLRDSGVKQMQITTHYKAEMIHDHFGDGSSHGVKVDYVNEDCPLGTAGALGLLKLQQSPFLVMNGDIVTKLDFRKMLDFHKEHKAEMTVAVRQYEMSVPFGVVETQGVNITKITEKPATAFLVNAGIYLLEPKIIEIIPAGQKLDMTDLIDISLAQGLRVVSFPIVEYWLDVGTPMDYERANEEEVNES